MYRQTIAYIISLAFTDWLIRLAIVNEGDPLCLAYCKLNYNYLGKPVYLCALRDTLDESSTSKLAPVFIWAVV